MKIILPIILILIGAAEIIAAVLDINKPIMIAAALGIIFIVLGVKTLFNASEKK